MAFIDIAQAIGEAETGSVGQGLLASAVRQGLAEGMSATNMLNDIRAAGGSIRTQSFYQLVGEVRASAARASEWATAPLDQVPGQDLVQDWTGGQADTYLNRVYMYVRTNIGGVLSVERRGVSILTKEAISPNDALAMAQGLYEDNADSDNYANEQFLGAEFGGVYHQLGAA